MDFPARLKALMAEAGDTPSGLARRIWGDTIHPRTGHREARNRDRISAWMKGRIRPNPDNRRLVAAAYGITVDDLFSDPEPEPEPPEGLSVGTVHPEGWSISTVPGMPDTIMVRNAGMAPEELMLLILRAMPASSFIRADETD